jgi:hypothetical protein
MTGGRDERGGPSFRSTLAGVARRPRWMTFLTVLMLLTGGRLLFGSFTDLQRVVTGKPDVLSLDGTFNAQQEMMLRAPVVLGNALARHRPVALAMHAVVRLVLGCLYLLAVAAVFAKDPRAARVAVSAGWIGVAGSGVHALFLVMVVRGSLPPLLPALAEAFAEDARRAGRPVLGMDVVAAQSHLILVDGPLVVAALGAAFSLVVVLYFGGRRARLFYNQLKQADHG